MESRRNRNNTVLFHPMKTKSTRKKPKVAAHHPDDPIHEDLKCLSTVCDMTFESARGITVANWNATPPPLSGRVGSRLTLTAPDANLVVYSLYTVGAQGRRWPVSIVAISGADVEFWNPKIGQRAWFSPGQVSTGKPLELPKTGTIPMGNGKFPPDEHGVWMIRFTGGTCTLDVISKRRRHGRAVKKLVTDHDYTPPPPEGGGENGEEE